MSFQQEKENTVKFIRQVFQNIKSQVLHHYKSEQPIREFTNLLKTFNILKDKLPDYNKKYLSFKDQEEVNKLQTLSDQIKTILIKSTQLNSKYIGRSCDYLNELTLSFEPEERQSLFTKDELQLLYELNRLCKDHTLQEFVQIDFLPSSLKSLDEAGNDLVYESHYKAFQMLIDITLNRKEKELKTTQNVNEIPYSYSSVRQAQDNIEKAFEPHKQTLYRNSWSIDQFRHSLTNILNECKHIDVQSANDSLFNCKIQKDQFILKTSNSRGYGSPTILHEFVIGSWLNQIRDINPGLMFTYGGFFCSPFDTEIKDLCRLEYNKVALTTILITEFIEGKPLKDFANSPSLPRLLKQVYYTLKIAYDKCRFCHNDLHSSNILVRQLPKEGKIHYSNTFIVSDMIPVLIDFGNSTIDLMTTDTDKQVFTPLRTEAHKVLHLYCFPTDLMNRDQPTIESKISQYGIASYPSYDWLRLLISLSSSMDHPSVLIPFIEPFVVYKNTHHDKYLPEDPTSIWIENVLNDKKCNSFFPTHNYPFFYEFNIYKHSPV